MEEEKNEGIILRSVVLNDSKRILTAFIPDEGIIALATHIISPSFSRLTSATTPLCRSELIYRKGKKDIYKLVDATLLADHLPLRSCHKRLSAACDIVQLLLRSQFPGKSAPLLYALTQAYLGRLQTSSSPQNLLASFYFKFLKHEGIFGWSKDPLPPFTSAQWQCIDTLVNSRSFQAIERDSLSSLFLETIKQFINQTLKLSY